MVVWPILLFFDDVRGDQSQSPVTVTEFEAEFWTNCWRTGQNSARSEVAGVAPVALMRSTQRLIVVTPPLVLGWKVNTMTRVNLAKAELGLFATAAAIAEANWTAAEPEESPTESAETGGGGTLEQFAGATVANV